MLDLEKYLDRQYEWSQRTFGPGRRTWGILDHISKETDEFTGERWQDFHEWIDVMILAFDGALRDGWTAQEICNALAAKQRINEARKWPDWRNFTDGQAIEHIRDEEEKS